MIKFCKSFSIVLILIIISISLKAKDSIVVYYFLLDECRVCQDMTPYINEIYHKYEHDFTFVGLFPNMSSKIENIEKFKSKFNLLFDMKIDYFQEKALLFGATIMPEVLVFNHTKQIKLYQGRINDLFYAPGKRKHFINYNNLELALASIKNKENNYDKETIPIGCLINFIDKHSSF